MMNFDEQCAGRKGCLHQWIIWGWHVGERRVVPTEEAAIKLLYLGFQNAWFEKFTPSKKSSHVQIVITKDEVKLIINQLSGTN